MSQCQYVDCFVLSLMSVNALAILFEAFANREIDPSKPIQQSIGFPKERKENNRQDLNMKFSFLYNNQML